MRLEVAHETRACGHRFNTVGRELYVIVREHFAGTSADANMNARLYVLRAPIEGRVTIAVKSIGARVNPGELAAGSALASLAIARISCR